MAEEHNAPGHVVREYDNIFNHVKSFGRYQKLLFGLTSLLVFPITSQFSALVFAFGTPGFHCTTPNVTCAKRQCCDGCKSYEFDGPFISTVSEWNLICDRAYLGSITLSCFFVGMLIGSLLGGMMSDAWGRKNCIFICNAIMLVAGVACTFVDCISFFAFLRFLVGFGVAGVMLPSYIYVIETIGPKHRTTVGSLWHLYFTGFALVFALLSYFIPSWRILLLITTGPTILLFPFWKWMPESPRWLVAHNRIEEALDAIQKYGGKDDKPIDKELLRNLLEEVRSEQVKIQKENKKYTPIDLVRTPRLRQWSSILCYEWFTTAFMNYVILLFFTQLSGNVYVNYAILRGTQALRIPFTWVLFLKFGRRITHGGIIFMGGVCLLLILAVYKDYPLAATGLSLAGALLVDTNWLGVYLITSELFPTILRNTAQGAGSTSARVGGIIAPYVAMLGQLPGLSLAFPAAICGVAGMIAGVIMYWVPETLYSPMRQTIEEVEAAEQDYGIPCCRKRHVDRPEPKSEINEAIDLDSKL